MNRTAVIMAGVVAIIGLAINASVDFDNVYDMTLAVLWVVTLILAFAGAFVGSKRASVATVSSSTASTTRTERR